MKIKPGSGSVQSDLFAEIMELCSSRQITLGELRDITLSLYANALEATNTPETDGLEAVTSCRQKVRDMQPHQ